MLELKSITTLPFASVVPVVLEKTFELPVELKLTVAPTMGWLKVSMNVAVTTAAHIGLVVVSASDELVPLGIHHVKTGLVVSAVLPAVTVTVDIPPELLETDPVVTPLALVICAG